MSVTGVFMRCNIEEHQRLEDDKTKLQAEVDRLREENRRLKLPLLNPTAEQIRELFHDETE